MSDDDATDASLMALDSCNGMASRKYFLQQRGKEPNIYTECGLDEVVQTILPASCTPVAETWLSELARDCMRPDGKAAAASDALNTQAEAGAFPRLVRADGFGSEANVVAVASEWEALGAYARDSRILTAGYATGRSVYGRYARVVQGLLLHVFATASGMVSCPLAMSDGALRLAESLLAAPESAGLQPYAEEALERATTLLLGNGENGGFSGQWMTERTGGSDVRACETSALPVQGKEEEGVYHLWGYKFFTSAATAKMAFTLAHIVEEGEDETGKGKGKEGKRPPQPSLFLVELDAATAVKEGSLVIMRLKDKMGTKALPTAELELRGLKATLIGAPKQGIRLIAPLFNLTRIHALIGSTAGLGYLSALLRDYSGKRYAFGKPLLEHDLHVATLSRTLTSFRGLLLLSVYITEVLGATEVADPDGNGPIAPDSVWVAPNLDLENGQALLRLLTPLGKLFGTRHANAGMIECLEGFGGAGYMEDTGLPRVFRDQFVNQIWEGPTNVIASDVVRVLAKEHNAFPAWVEAMDTLLEGSDDHCSLAPAVILLRQAVVQLRGLVSSGLALSDARAFSFGLARVFVGGLLTKFALVSDSQAHGQAYLSAALLWVLDEPLLPQSLLDPRLGGHSGVLISRSLL